MTLSTDWQCDKSLLDCFEDLLRQNQSTDVTFLLGKDKLPIHAHKLILITRSSVFRAMLQAQTGDIEIADIKKRTFWLLLLYLYTDKISLNVTMVLPVMDAARKFSVFRLIEVCKVFIGEILNMENVGFFLEEAHIYMEEEVLSKCLVLIQQNAEQFLQSDSFTSLSQENVFRITKTDELYVPNEQHVFEAVMKWSALECTRQLIEITDSNRRKVLGKILYEIRFPLITDNYFVTQICYRDLLSGEEIKNIFKMKRGKVTSEIFKTFPRRGYNHPKIAIFLEYVLPYQMVDVLICLWFGFKLIRVNFTGRSFIVEMASDVQNLST